MTELKSFIGRKSELFKYSVTEEKLRKFCEAVGASYRGEAPMTFLTRFRDGEFALLAEMNINLSQVLHGDQEFHYSGAVKSGDELEFDAAMTKALEKKGASGGMRILVFETDVRKKTSAQSISVGTMKTTIIVRGEA